MWTANVIAWISTGLATGIGIYITESPWCLVAFLLPMMFGVNCLNKNDKNSE